MPHHPSNPRGRQTKRLHLVGNVNDVFEVGLSANVSLTLENRHRSEGILSLSDVDTMVDTGFTGELIINHEIARSLGIPIPPAPADSKNKKSRLLDWIASRSKNSINSTENQEPIDNTSSVEKITFGDGSSGYYRVHPLYIVCRDGTQDIAILVSATVIPRKDTSKRNHEAVLGMNAMYQCVITMTVNTGSQVTISSLSRNRND